MTHEEERGERDVLDRERFELLQRVEDRLEMPMVVLGLAWLVLLVIELVRGLTPILEAIGTVVWVIFILDS